MDTPPKAGAPLSGARKGTVRNFFESPRGIGKFGYQLKMTGLWEDRRTSLATQIRIAPRCALGAQCNAGIDRGKTVTKHPPVEATWVGFEQKADSPSC